MQVNSSESKTGGSAQTAVRQWFVSLTMVALALAPGPLLASDADLLFRTVALTDNAAPGTGDGAYFESFMVFVSPSDLAPRIDAQGTAAFFAFVAGGLVNPDTRYGHRVLIHARPIA